MHIILVSNRLATAKTLQVTPRMVLIAVAGFLALSFATVFLLSWFGIRFNLPFASRLVDPVQPARFEPRLHVPYGSDSNWDRNQDYVRSNLSSMAVKLGEMQAQVMRLDSLGERISKLSGVDVPAVEVKAKGKDGKGGPLIAATQPLYVEALQRDIDRLGEIVEERTEVLTELESRLMERRIRITLLPTIVPINADHIGSTFGRRIDPIAGVMALHEGIDFVADKGTRVIASAGGVVVTSDFHPQYGNMIEIDHGNDFSSVYAHLSRRDVKPGQIVKRGQTIGASGNTGRSTGPHLHFEVRFKGVAQNPSRFLLQGSQLALNSAFDLKPGASAKAPTGREAPAGAVVSAKRRRPD